MSALAGARVVVTGAQGFIGAVVARQLAEAGADVTCLCRPQTPEPIPEGARRVDADLLADPDLAPVLRDADFVVHLAALAGGIQFQHREQAEIHHANTSMTRAVVEGARAAGVRRIFLASSGVVYLDSAEPAIPESAPVVTPASGPVSGYAWSKLSDEVVAAWVNEPGAFETVIGRFTNVYGPGGSFDPARSTVIHALVRKAVEAAPDRALEVWGDGTAVRSFIHVEDAARAVLILLEHGRAGEAYNIDTSQAVTVREIAEMVRDAVDPRIQLRFDADQPQGAARRVLDSDKLQALGFSARTSLREGIGDTIRHIRDSAGRPA